MIMDAVAMLLLVISTWQSLSAVPSCLEDDHDSRKWMSWQWLSVKLMWCVMLPIMLGTWHRIAVLRAREQSGIRLSNLEQDVSIKSEVAKNWHARFLLLYYWVDLREQFYCFTSEASIVRNIFCICTHYNYYYCYLLKDMVHKFVLLIISVKQLLKLTN